MPALRRHLSDRVVAEGGTLTLAVEVAGDADGVTFAWQHDNLPVAGAAGATHEIAPVAAGDAGVWAVTATDASGGVSSSATVVVVATEAAPYAWKPTFARIAAIVTAVVAGVAVVPLWVRGWFLVSDAPGRADTALVAILLAVAGTALLAAAAFAVVVEVRGRADAAGPASPARTVQLLVLAGLLTLGVSGLLGWHLGDPPATPAPVPTPTRTP